MWENTEARTYVFTHQVKQARGTLGETQKRNVVFYQNSFNLLSNSVKDPKSHGVEVFSVPRRAHAKRVSALGIIRQQ